MSNADQVVDALIQTGKWSETAARRGLRANFRCEYCGRDLLASVNDYKEWEEDHIVPLSAGGTDDEANIAIACRTCNYHAKRGWDPRPSCGPAATRDEFIAAVRLYVEKRRTEFLKDVASFRAIVFPGSR